MAQGLFWKIGVAPKSTLTAKISATKRPDVWNADLYLRRKDGGLVAHYDNAQLRAGIAEKLVGSNPEHYWGQLVITFAGASSARVELAVLKPDGSMQGKKYDEVHSAASADAVAIAAFMA
jgi:hypothetical protein